jgi:hypothetical protein
MKKILAAATHTGGAQAIAPVLHQLMDSYDISLVRYPLTDNIFKKYYGLDDIMKEYNHRDFSINSVEEFVNELQPDMMILGQACQDKETRNVLEQNLTLEGKKKNIPTLSVSDFWTGRKKFFSDERTNFKFLPDYVTVIDQRQLDIMVDEGFPKDILYITGNPYFDSLKSLSQNFSEQDNQKVRNDLGLQGYLILFASGPIEFYYGSDSTDPYYLGYTEKTVLIDLMESIQQISDHIDLLVKAHPREDQEELQNLIRFYGKKYKVDKLYDTKKAVLASDVVISTFSTVLIEASYMDKPCISIQPGLLTDDLLVTNSMGVTVPVYNKEEITPTLLKVMYDNQYQKQLADKRKDFRSEKDATKNVVDLVSRILH